MQHFTIAIDGPAGAGKSTIAKAVAARLNFIYVDTGAMYRAMALYFVREGFTSFSDESFLQSICARAQITIRYEEGTQQVILNDENVSSLIRTEEVGKQASIISSYLPVRQKLVELQQQLAREANVIMDGRDIGTCVLPKAQAKIYLTASAKVRARRRFQELKAKGQECSLEEIQKEIEDRDYRDMHREHSPLTQAEDAVLVDTSAMTIEQVIDRIIQIAEEKGLHEDNTWK